MIVLPDPTAKDTVASLSEALEFFHKEKLASDADSLVLYRGHGDADWRITPSIFRQDPQIERFEDKLTRELISLFPNEFASDQSMFDRLVRMQHFGLPTRLLDASRNPLVSLYFACSDEPDKDGAVIIFDSPNERAKFYDSDTVSCLANLSNLSSVEKLSIGDSSANSIPELAKLHAVDRLVQFIRVEKPHFAARIKKLDLFRPVSVVPKMSNARLNAQFGAFVLFGLDRSEGVRYSKTSTVSKVIVPAALKASILDRLSSIGISGSTLFPEIDKASKQIVKTYKEKAA